MECNFMKIRISKSAKIGLNRNTLRDLFFLAGGHTETVQLLLNAGATDTANAYMQAEQYHRTDIMGLLKDASR